MTWNWQQPDWPHFTWSADRLVQAEQRYWLGTGVILGAVEHLDGGSRERLRVGSMGEEALATSEIEGELLNRDSVRSSLRRQLGLATDGRRALPAEQGIAEMMVDLHRNSAQALDEATLCSWHEMLMRGRQDLHEIGQYRTHSEPVQVVSGKLDEPTVHFEAPAFDQVPTEMNRFITWFNRTAPSGEEPLPALTRAGLAHLYFESIHPFEDGNGRIGRAISEKALAQSSGEPGLVALATTILVRRSAYYKKLEANNKQVQVSDWLAWFAGIVLEAQQRTRVQVEFSIDKTKLLDSLRGRLNKRQEAVLLRVLQEGPDGFEGGLSAGNYISIAKTSRATATRDLASLVELKALCRTGERRHMRYHLTIPLRPVGEIKVDETGAVV